VSDQQVQDESYMRRALELACLGEQLGEIPVGAVIVNNGEVIGEGFNQPISSHDPTAHAEIVAMRMAAQQMQNYRLVGATLYVTLEPCTMCVGALIHARIARLVYGTTEPKAGAVESRSEMLKNEFFNHHMEYTGGICSSECQQQLTVFFQRRREQIKQIKREK
jgi:tRNA(adenine34) deaminase